MRTRGRRGRVSLAAIVCLVFGGIACAVWVGVVCVPMTINHDRQFWEQPYLDGRDAAKAGVPATANPYKDRSFSGTNTREVRWLQGWMDGKKQTEVKD